MTNDEGSFHVNAQGRLSDDELAILTRSKRDSIHEFREIFRLIDLDDSGYLDVSELKKLAKLTLRDDALIRDDSYYSNLIFKFKNEFSKRMAITRPSNESDQEISVMMKLLFF